MTAARIADILPRPALTGRIGPGRTVDDVYRPLLRADCAAIAHHYNLNLERSDPLWCAGGRTWDANRIWMHRSVLMVRGRGRLIAQVHERGGCLHSYFGGYESGRRATFSIGVVNLDLADPMETWRRDTAHLFQASLERGIDEFRIHASSDRASYVDWMEREVGMDRLEGKNVWLASGQTMASYVDGYTPVGSRLARPDPELHGQPITAPG